MIRERLIAIWDKERLSAPKLEKLTGIDRSSWYHLRNGKRRANEEDIEALVKLFPRYAFWIASGHIAPEIGQTSPDYDEANKKLAGQDAGSR